MRKFKIYASTSEAQMAEQAEAALADAGIEMRFRCSGGTEEENARAEAIRAIAAYDLLKHNAPKEAWDKLMDISNTAWWIDNRVRMTNGAYDDFMDSVRFDERLDWARRFDVYDSI